MNAFLNYLNIQVLFRTIKLNLWIIDKIRRLNQALDKRLQACLARTNALGYSGADKKTRR